MEKTGEKTNGVQRCKRLHFEEISSASIFFGSSKWFRKGLEFRWVRINMKHSYHSNYFITCLPSFFSIIKVII